MPDTIKNTGAKTTRNLLFCFFGFISCAWADKQRCIEASRNSNPETMNICDQVLDHPDTTVNDVSVVLITQAEYLLKKNEFLAADEKLELAFNSNPEMLKNGIYRLNWARKKGNLYSLKAEYENALPYYQQALEIAQIMGRPQLIAGLYNDLGATHTDLGQYQLALDALQSSLRIEQDNLSQGSSVSHFKMALTLANMATIYEAQQQFNKALQTLFKSLDAHKKNLQLHTDEDSLYQPYIAHVHEDIGDIYTHLNDFVNAEQYLTTALDTYARYELSGQQIRVLSALSKMYNQNQQYEKAMAQIRQALSIESTTENEGHVGLREQLVEVYMSAGNLSQANLSAKEGLAYAKQKGNLKSQSSFLLMLANINHKEGHLADAYDYLQQHQHIEQKLLQDTFNLSLGKLQSEIELNRSQKEISLLENEQIIKELTISRQRWIISIIAMLLFVAIVGLMLVIKKKNKERQILREDMRLHEDKLKLLATDTNKIRAIFSHLDVPLLCVSTTGEVLFKGAAMKELMSLPDEQKRWRFPALFPIIWEYILEHLGENEKLEQDLLLNKQQIEHSTQGSVVDVWIHQMDFIDHAFVILFIDHSHAAQTLQTAENISNYTEFKNLIWQTVSNTSTFNVMQADQLKPVSKILNDLNKAIESKGLPKSRAEKANLKVQVVDLMITALNTWQTATGTTAIELAEKSGLWLINVDNGQLRTRTLDKYIDINKIPQAPRWRQVVKTAHFILSTCDLNHKQRDVLKEKINGVMSSIRSKALGNN